MTNAPQAQGKLRWTLGDRLGKALRLESVSVAEMARELGVSRNTVGNYIADRTPVRDQTIRVWAMRTGVPFNELKLGITSSGPDGNGGITGAYAQGTRKSHNWAANVTAIRNTLQATRKVA